jgi:hypothetical protein
MNGLIRYNLTINNLAGDPVLSGLSVAIYDAQDPAMSMAQIWRDDSKQIAIANPVTPAAYAQLDNHCLSWWGTAHRYRLRIADVYGCCWVEVGPLDHTVVFERMPMGYRSVTVIKECSGPGNGMLGTIMINKATGDPRPVAEFSGNTFALEADDESITITYWQIVFTVPKGLNQTAQYEWCGNGQFYHCFPRWIVRWNEL